jgi:hypothetical protein
VSGHLRSFDLQKEAAEGAGWRKSVCEGHLANKSHSALRKFATASQIQNWEARLQHLQEEGLKPMVLNLADDVFPGGCVDVGAGS